jgi:hypothetical protein
MPPVGGRRTGPPSLPTGDAFAHREVAAARDLVADLPEPERTFLTLKVAGYRYNEIAAELGVSWLTVNPSSCAHEPPHTRPEGDEAATRVVHRPGRGRP